MASGPPRPVTPEPTSTGFFHPLLPDGRATAGVTPEGRLLLFPFDGSEPRLLLEPAPDQRLLRWDAGGRALFVASRLGVPARVERLDLATGRRENVRQLSPADPAGVLTLASIHLAADGASYAYTYGRLLSDLYVVSGLR